MKELLIKYCQNLEDILSIKEKRKVVFFSGWKESIYFLPQIMIGSNPPKLEKAWFCEVWVDNMCVFRESRITIDDKSEEELENQVINVLMGNIFNHGIMSAKRVIEEHRNTVRC